MRSPTPTRRAVCLGALGAAPAVTQSPANLLYQKRGRYFEGTRGSASTGVPLDLIAAMVDYREPYSSLPPRFQAVLWVPRNEPVYLTVREIEPEHYYWLDNAEPERGWQAGTLNWFQWPTGAVIRYLNHLALNNLGAVAQLGGEDRSKPETVAPVALYHSRPPAEALGYRFVFRPLAGVHLTFTVMADGSTTPVANPQVLPQMTAGEAQTITWKSAGWPEGWYRLSASGYRLSDNTPVDRRIRFYHRPALDR